MPRVHERIGQNRAMTSEPAEEGTGKDASILRGPVELDTPLKKVLGERLARPFAKSLGLNTVDDLLWHLPRRYTTRGELTAMTELPEGEHVSMVAEVLRVTERKMRSRGGSILEATISDGTGTLVLTFFNQPWRKRDLVPGVRGMFSGKISRYRGRPQLAHPDFEVFENAELQPGSAQARKWAQTPIPIYPSSAQVATWVIQRAIGEVLDAIAPIGDPVPGDVRAERGEPSLDRALRLIHQPETIADTYAAKAALRTTEAVVFQTALLQQRADSRSVPGEPRPTLAGGVLDRFDAALPFALTGDQRAAGEDIARELASSTPMQRLLQGEVGSGKTLVALRAMLQVADARGQSALLAPTEVLAAQHLRSITESLGHELAELLQPTLLTGSMSVKDRRRALLRIASGDARIVIGTHALLGEKVQFADLGLVIVDEQHRFGVEQREALRARGRTAPHVLVMTATPIPRTVAMTVFGDLDVSTMSELPAGRQKIETFTVAALERPAWLERVWERVAEEVREGRQAFVVCPAITAKEAETPEDAEPDSAGADAGETDAPPPCEPATVEQTLAELRAMPRFAGVRIEALHGQLSGDEKDALMRDFAAGRIHVIVATTVIEVGVNVPNATVMVVLDADRFGVSQLHQLRGRVGRGEFAGLCLLVTNAPADTTARERVDAVAGTLDGFALAEADLRLRREGDVLGAVQSGGRSSLRVLRVVDDADVIEQARMIAADVLEADPELASHPALAEAVRRVGDRERAFLNAS